MTRTKLRGFATCYVCEQCLFAGDEAYVGKVIVCVECREKDEAEREKEWTNATPAE